MTYTIALDIDGVVFNAQQAHIDSANALFNTSYELKDVVKYDYSNFPRNIKQHFIKCWDMLDYNTLAPVEGFYEAIEELKHLGRVIAVSAPMDGSLHITSKWGKLTKLFGEKNVILTRSKDLVAADILIDDAPKYIDQWLGTDRPLVIMEQPWNRDHIANLDVGDMWTSVVSTFSDIPKAVEDLLIW